MEPVQPDTEFTMTTKEHPILLSGPLVRAILDGRKTQTRRLIRSRQPKPGFAWRKCLCGEIDPTDRPCLTCSVRYGLEEPKYKVGDRLWVRESWMPGYDHRSVDQGDDKSICEVIYRGAGDTNVSEFRPAPDDIAEEWSRNYSEDGDDDPRWRPSIHMPRWASRLSLEVTEVRVQRIQEITEEDARAEGVHEHPLGRAALDARGTHKGAFLAVWEAINGARPGGSIAANPWAWAVSFKRVQG